MVGVLRVGGQSLTKTVAYNRICTN